MDVNDQALNAIAEFIQQVQPGSMVQRFVLLVETIDDEDRWMSGFTAPGQKEWDTIGILDWGLALERSHVQLGLDDDED